MELLVATLVGEDAAPTEGLQKLSDCVLLGEKATIEIAVVADATRDLLGKLSHISDEHDVLPELDFQLSELVRLASEQMASMRRFEALAEIHRHVRLRLADIINTPNAEITMDDAVGEPANDHFPA